MNLLHHYLSTKGLKGEGKNKREKSCSKCKSEAGGEQKMYLLPREHVTPHRSLRIPGDLICTCDTLAFYLIFILST